MEFCKAMTHILIPVHIFFILGRQIVSSRESRSRVLEFIARTLLTCNILSFIIESQVFCLAIFIYMFSFCINKTMIYFKFFSFSLLRSRASEFFVRTSEILGALALQDKFVWKKISSPESFWLVQSVNINRLAMKFLEWFYQHDIKTKYYRSLYTRNKSAWS